MNNGRFDRALLLAILAALGGLYWQVFSMNERLARVETHLEHIVPRPSDTASEQLPGG
ncbi:MAG: hypothetical protein OXQ89_20245 [Rhodospirillaceae bacterium]|nr:hypothetical protein [Rhodospirillaceae bacterium]MDE0000081.1 hypothetical protein [Rhodospirillaceae bacterium]